MSNGMRASTSNTADDLVSPVAGQRSAPVQASPRLLLRVCRHAQSTAIGFPCLEVPESRRNDFCKRRGPCSKANLPKWVLCGPHDRKSPKFGLFMPGAKIGKLAAYGGICDIFGSHSKYLSCRARKLHHLPARASEDIISSHGPNRGVSFPTVIGLCMPKSK